MTDKTAITKETARSEKESEEKAVPAEKARQGKVSHSNPIDGFAYSARKVSPAWLVNSGTQVNFGLKAGADAMSLWSSVRKGSASPMRFVASVITLFTEILGIAYKEKPISDEQQEKYKAMSLPGYVLTKTKESFDPKNHILETVGLATIGNGLFTTLSGLAQSSKKKVSWEIFQGVMTTVAGLIMNYMPDRERAWQISTAVFWTRAPVAGKQAWDAYTTGFPDKGIAKGDWQQGAKWVLNQTSNIFGFLYGGVKKMPDGTIIHIGKKGDDAAPRSKKVEALQLDKSAAQEVVPTSQIQQIAEHTLPQREQAAAQAK